MINQISGAEGLSMLGAIVEAVVLCRDVAAAAAFNQAAFDLEVLETSGNELVMGVAGSPTGRIRLTPGPIDGVSRADPEMWDTGPRLLGMYSRNIELTAARIVAAGGSALPLTSYPYGASTMYEFVGLGSDGVYWTIPEVGLTHRPSPALAGDLMRLHSELHSAVLVTADHDATLDFFVAGGGLNVIFDGELAGENFERLLGMPSGAIVRLSFLACADQSPARMEIMSFSGVEGENRREFPIGLRRLVFASDDVEGTMTALEKHGGRRLGFNLIGGPDGLEVQILADSEASK